MTLTYAAQRVALWTRKHDTEDVEIPARVCNPEVMPAVFDELERLGYAEHVKSLSGSSLLLTGGGRGLIAQQEGMIRANIVQRLLLVHIAAHNDCPFEPITFISSTAIEFSGQADGEELQDAASSLQANGLIDDVNSSPAGGPVRPYLTGRGRAALRSPYAPSEVPAGIAVGNSYTQNNQFGQGGAASQGDNNTINQQNTSADFAQLEAAIAQMRELIQQVDPSMAEFAGNQLDTVTAQAREGLVGLTPFGGHRFKRPERPR